MIIYSSDCGIARIVLNRPEKRNALSPELIESLQSSLARSARDPEVRVVAISGAGSDFCSGADLAGLDLTANQDVMEHLGSARAMADVFLAIRHHPRPVVALVRGRALAGGCGVATACDLIVAAESAQFGYPEVNIGFVPAMVMAILRRSLNEKQAFEMIAMGEILSAARAESAGLVNRVFIDTEFDARSEQFIAALAAKSPSALALCKNLLYHMDGMTFESAIEAGIHGNALARMTEDARRGIEKFLKKG